MNKNFEFEIKNVAQNLRQNQFGTIIPWQFGPFMSNNFIKFEKNKQVSNFTFVANVYNYSGSWFNEICFIEKDDSLFFFRF